MNEKQYRPVNWPLIAVVVAIAAAFGFGAAKFLAPSSAVSAIATSTPTQPQQKGAAVSTDPGFPEVNIPSAYLATAGIAVERIGEGGMRSLIPASGTVTAAPNSEAVVVARAAGNLTRINRQPGDSVKAGDVLALVESLEASTMAAERSMTSARAELARKNLARESSLFAEGITARQEMEAAQAALAVAEAEAKRAASVARAANLARDGSSLAVVSPIDGKVAAQAVTIGAYVQPDTELFRVAGNAQPLVQAAISAADIGRLKTGDSATIIAASGAPVAATIRSITSTVSGTTRAAMVILTPTSPQARLVVGEGVQVRLHTSDAGSGLLVPEDAVQNIEGRDVLFVRTKEGFRPTPVLVGTRSGGIAQIIQGVGAGDMVATRNAFLIKADMIKSEEE